MIGKAKVQLTQENIKFCMLNEASSLLSFLQREQEIAFWKSHAAFPHVHTELPQAGEGRICSQKHPLSVCAQGR